MFGEILTELMMKKNMGVAKFRDITGISAGYMSDLKKNRYLPSKTKLEIIIATLELNKDEELQLREEWALSKSDDSLRKTVIKLKEKNKDMLDVLKSVKKENELANEIKSLENYKIVYDLLFSDLNQDEAKELLKSISEKLEIIALRKNKYDKVKNKIEKLNSIIESIK
ncbi:hypothetical protein [Fusobacterium varium]|uniref:hypothetical protein n=1 Tax=Fusobacterium varium TaxID=856 RepID=UPI003F0F3583